MNKSYNRALSQNLMNFQFCLKLDFSNYIQVPIACMCFKITWQIKCHKQISKFSKEKNKNQTTVFFQANVQCNQVWIFRYLRHRSAWMKVKVVSSLFFLLFKVNKQVSKYMG